MNSSSILTQGQCILTSTWNITHKLKPQDTQSHIFFYTKPHLFSTANYTFSSNPHYFLLTQTYGRYKVSFGLTKSFKTHQVKCWILPKTTCLFFNLFDLLPHEHTHGDTNFLHELKITSTHPVKRLIAPQNHTFHNTHLISFNTHSPAERTFPPGNQSRAPHPPYPLAGPQRSW